ncbi:MAG: sortase domain-bontaining protein [Enterococcus sp.]
MNSLMRRRFIFSDVIVCLFFLASLIIFSTISDAQSQSKKETHESQVRIYGEDKVTINVNDSFNPNQYYKAVGDDHRPVQLNYTNINTSKPGRYALILTAKNKQDYDKRTVLIVIEEEKTAQKAEAEKEAPPSQEPTSSSKEKTPESTKSSASQAPAANAPIETPQSTEKAQEAPPQQEPVEAAQEIQQETPEAAKPTTETPPQQKSVQQPNQIALLGTSIPYQNAGQGSGQGIINGGSVAATWGGNPTQSGTDNQNTHFIGHNPGVFSPILSLGAGSPITVTDSAGNATTYIVNGIIQVDDSGRDIHSGQDNWDQITSAGGGERITLQTCITDAVNLIVFAQA